MIRMTTRLPASILLFTAAYCVASFAHFFHNAEFLAEYPNMPGWLMRWQVYAIWLGITSIGVVGLVFARSRRPAIGFLLLAAYAAFGFDGLGHYSLASMSSHTVTMNLTIWCEVVAAALLLLASLRCLLVSRRAGHR